MKELIEFKLRILISYSTMYNMIIHSNIKFIIYIKYGGELLILIIIL